MTDLVGGVAGRVVVVTGSGAGIGLGIARYLGRRRARVVLADIDEQGLRSASARLTDDGADVLAVRTDVADRQSVNRMVAECIKRWGRVDGLVNNAMTVRRFVPLAELDDAAIDAAVDSGLKGTVYGMQAVYPHMRSQGWGRIVNVGSAAGIVSFKGMGAYGAAKEAIRSLTRTAAREWAGDGITVNVFCPLATSHLGRGDPVLDDFIREGMEVVSALRPVDRDGDAETDIGPVVAFLLSDDCRYLTGQTLMLDGGTYAFA